MKIENTASVLKKLESDKAAQHLIAQGNSRYILFSVDEPIDNFPAYDPQLNIKLENIAISYLSIGCSFAENNDYVKASDSLYRGASILESTHKPVKNRSKLSNYYLLISALAYYSSYQYSKAFVLLRDIEYESDSIIAGFVSAFLRKDFSNLIILLNSVFLSDSYDDETVSAMDDREADGRTHAFLSGLFFSRLLEFIYSGNNKWIDSAAEALEDLKMLSSLNDDPAMWWIARLLRIILGGFRNSCLWKVLPPKFGNHPEIIHQFISGLTYREPPVVELFITQRLALQKVLSPSGAVMSLPTSSGKTRIAELAILQCLLENSTALVLYLAPFRSLAFEIEESLEKSFKPISYEVSHLYGGSQFSKIDRTLIEESQVIIATPEKAKAILRADPDLVSRIKLTIIDEGHLIGTEKRFIQNEIFTEELRFHMKKNQGKILLLSAVLPNANEISKWITESEENAVKDDWRPSSQRMGLMEWNGNNVNIEWLGSYESFNKNFVKKFIPKGKKKEFPSNKVQAIAAAAIKFSNYGSTLIFVGRTNMVETQAREIVVALGDRAEQHKWVNKNDWKAFQLACEESVGPESDILRFARSGIICHSSKLPAEVRSTVERLMRNGNPKFIISTSTLGQGVNLGVSNVIFANIWLDRDRRIGYRDFWNIAGRAGRAFTDSEGKILYVIDKSITPETDFKSNSEFKTYRAYRKRREWQIKQDIIHAMDYFDSGKLEHAVSGILGVVKSLHLVAKKCQIDFDMLLQLIAENNYAKCGDEKGDYSEFLNEVCELIDDTLLSLNYEFHSYELDDAAQWVEAFFRQSLAYIQAEYLEDTNGDDVIAFLKARNSGVLKLAGDHSNWRSYICTGIPLLSSIAIDQKLDEVLKIASIWLESERTVDDLINFLKETEKIISALPSRDFKQLYKEDDIDLVRKLWIAGAGLSIIKSAVKNGQEICVSYFGFTLPWAINAVAKRLAILGHEDKSKEYENLAILSELGLPNLFAAKIYLAGVKSRTGATELSTLLNPKFIDKSVRELANIINANYNKIIDRCTSFTAKWLKVFVEQSAPLIKEINKIRNFAFKEPTSVTDNTLSVRSFNNTLYLVSPDYTDKIKVTSSDDFPFHLYNNDSNVSFQFDEAAQSWEMKIRNPYLKFHV